MALRFWRRRKLDFAQIGTEPTHTYFHEAHLPTVLYATANYLNKHHPTKPIGIVIHHAPSEDTKDRWHIVLVER